MHSSLKRNVDFILGTEVLFESFSVGILGETDIIY